MSIAAKKAEKYTTKEGFVRINISGYRYLLSQGPAKFNNESIFGLNVGDKIKQIGVSLKSKTNKGGETCSNRFDRFETYLEYAGTRIMEINDQAKKALLFRVKEPEITGLEPGQYLYCVYELLHEGLNDAELVRPNMDELTIRIYRPEFEKI